MTHSNGSGGMLIFQHTVCRRRARFCVHRMSTDVGGNFIGDEEEAGVDDVQSEHSGDHHYAVKKVCSSMSVAIPRYDRTEHTKEPLGSDDCSMPTARELGRTVDRTNEEKDGHDAHPDQHGLETTGRLRAVHIHE